MNATPLERSMLPAKRSTFTDGETNVSLDIITCYKFLQMESYHVGDLQYMFMVQGRHGHAGSKCPFCDATRTGKDGDLRVYGPCACRGADWTIDRIQTEVKNYIRAHAPEEGEEPEVGDELEARDMLIC
jgi:hypothetical protein